MKCKVCGAECRVNSYQKDDPILECGHLQAADPELHSVEQVVYDSEIKIASYMNKFGLTREEAQDRITLECLKSLSPKARLDTIKTLTQANLTTPPIEEIKAGLSNASRRYLKS